MEEGYLTTLSPFHHYADVTNSSIIKPFSIDFTNESFDTTRITSTNRMLTNETAKIVSGKHSATFLMHLYLIPVVITIGFIGNGLSFLVFTCTNQKHLSSAVYLAALALVDSTFLVQLLVSWLGYLRIFLIHRQGWCQIFIYISYVTSFLSVWLIVAFTVERFIVCSYPLRRNTMCTTSRAKIVTASLAGFAVIAYSYGAWTSGAIMNSQGHRQCVILPQFQSLVVTISIIDTVFTLVVPVLAIIIMNMKIVYKVLDLSEKRSPLQNKGSCSRNPSMTSMVTVWDSEGPSRASQSGMSTRTKSQMKVTKMLLVVSSIFVLLNLPSHAVRVYDTFQKLVDPTHSSNAQLIKWQDVFTFFYYCNFSVNFFLYSLCGMNFRRALYSMLSRWRTNLVTCLCCKILCCCCCDHKLNGIDRRIPRFTRQGSPFEFRTVGNRDDSQRTVSPVHNSNEDSQRLSEQLINA